MDNVNIEYFETNEDGTDYYVTDIHGCYNQLAQALHYIKFDSKKDRLFVGGDLIDRGKDNTEALMFALATNVHSIRGNHEQLMIDAVLNNDQAAWYIWRRNGGEWADHVARPILIELAEIAQSLPEIIVVRNNDKRINIVHAELTPQSTTQIITDQVIDNNQWSDRQREAMLWGRSWIYRASSLFQQQQMQQSTTLVGHTPITYPRKTANHIYCDLGVVYNKQFSLVDIFGQEIYIFKQQEGSLLPHPEIITFDQVETL